MTIADQVAALQADRDALFAQCDALMKQVERQRGAIQEGRDERAQLRQSIERERKQFIETIQRMQTQLEAWGSHFKAVYRGLSDLEAKRANTAEKIEQLSPNPKANGTLTARLAAVNGHANGAAA